MGDDGSDDVLARLHALNHAAVRWLGVIILVAVLGILLIALVDSTFIGEFISTRRADGSVGGIASRGTQTDQAVAILGNIASAGIGGLVGWITRDFTLRTQGVRLDSPQVPPEDV